MTCAGPSVFHEGKICFGNARTEGMLFLDCYGYVELELVAELEDDTRIRLYSDYLPVLVRKGGFHETVRKWYIMCTTTEKIFCLTASRSSGDRGI